MTLKVNTNFNIQASEMESDSKSSAHRADGNYKISTGETLYSLMKKLNFKNEAEVRSFFKLSGTQSLKKGQSLSLPTAKLETTVYALARKYNMSFNDLKALNPHIKDFSKLPKGALINVPIRPFSAAQSSDSQKTSKKSDDNKTQEKSSKHVSKKQSIETETPPKKSAANTPAKTQARSSSKLTVTQKAEQAEAVKNKGNKPVQSLTSKEIAEKLREISKKVGAISSEEFKKTFEMINKNNIVEVLEEYAKIKGNKESLIEMILSEVSNKKDDRKNAVMKIYDLVAERAGDFVATPQRRKAFENELTRQLTSWNVTNFFMANPKYLDRAIDELLESFGENAGSTPRASVSKSSSRNNGVLPDGGKAMVKKAPAHTKITVNGHKTDKTIAQVHKDWEMNAARWKRTVTRPEPVTDEHGNITAGVTIYEDKNVKNGVLSGKTIIINPGHGAAMANPKSSTEGQLMFDPGSSNAVMNGNVETNVFIGNGGQPLEEWHVNSKFAADLTKQLVSQGAKVIYITGSVHTVPKAIRQYRKDADMVVSLHSNSAGNSRGIKLIGTDLVSGSSRISDKQDLNFAKILQNQLNEHSWFRGITEAKTQGLAVLRDGSNRPYDGPDILIETGNLKNEKDVANLNSRKFREYLVDGIDSGIVRCLTGQKHSTP